MQTIMHYAFIHRGSWKLHTLTKELLVSAVISGCGHNTVMADDCQKTSYYSCPGTGAGYGRALCLCGVARFPTP